MISILDNSNPRRDDYIALLMLLIGFLGPLISFVIRLVLPFPFSYLFGSWPWYVGFAGAIWIIILGIIRFTTLQPPAKLSEKILIGINLILLAACNAAMFTWAKDSVVNPEYYAVLSVLIAAAMLAMLRSRRG